MIGNKKGQSAMEYLMTYGWALLVIVIVIAVLLWINPFKAPEQCIFDQPGFVCGRPVLQSNGVLFADITNGNQKSIVITGVACVKGRTPLPGTASSWPSLFSLDAYGNKTVTYQDSFNLGNYTTDGAGSGTHATSCTSVSTDGTGTPIATTFKPGEDFNGRIYIAYKFTDDSPQVPAKIVGANLVTKAQ